MGESVTCVVADDHPAMRAAVSDVLSDYGMTVLGIAADGVEAVERIESAKPHVAVIDVRMPLLSGIEVARRVAITTPDTAFLFYTAYGDRSLLAEALDVGARGFVLKEAPVIELVRAVERVAAGESYVDPVLAGILVGIGLNQRIAALTEREREVLRLLADGRSNEEIGRQLFVSPQTVRTHVRKAMVKLEAETRTHAVATALRQSIIP
jgi:DNA-binding NarL/FixJ family response regulator